MSILDRYIAKSLFTSTLLVCSVIIALQCFLALVNQFQLVGQNHYDLWDACWFMLMQEPSQFYQLFPMSAFLGALIGLGRLSANSELIIMRASGVSVLRVAWSVIKAAVLMIIVVTLLGEGIGPQLQQQSQKFRQVLLFPPKNESLLHAVWLHQGNSFTRIGVLENQNTMFHITRYRFAPTGQLHEVSAARMGHLSNERWKLFEVKNTIFHPDRVVTDKQAQGNLHAEFKPNLEVQMQINSAEQSILNLYHTILYRKEIGLGVNQYIFAFWQRILQPITTLVMICLAVPFVFGSFRNASMGLRIMTGVMIGFIFYLLNQLFGPITLVYQFPPIWAAAIPTCLFLFIAVILLVRAR